MHTWWMYRKHFKGSTCYTKYYTAGQCTPLPLHFLTQTKGGSKRFIRYQRKCSSWIPVNNIMHVLQQFYSVININYFDGQIEIENITIAQIQKLRTFYQISHTPQTLLYTYNCLVMYVVSTRGQQCDIYNTRGHHPLSTTYVMAMVNLWHHISSSSRTILTRNNVCYECHTNWQHIYHTIRVTTLLYVIDIFNFPFNALTAHLISSISIRIQYSERKF